MGVQKLTPEISSSAGHYWKLDPDQTPIITTHGQGYPATKLTKEVNSPSAPGVLVLFAKPKRANLDFENCWVIIGNDAVNLTLP